MVALEQQKMSDHLGAEVPRKVGDSTREDAIWDSPVLGRLIIEHPLRPPTPNSTSNHPLPTKPWTLADIPMRPPTPSSPTSPLTPKSPHHSPPHSHSSSPSHSRPNSPTSLSHNIRHRLSSRSSGNRQLRVINLPGSSQYSFGAASSCIPSCMEACMNFLCGGAIDTEALMRILTVGSLYRGFHHLEVSKVISTINRYNILEQTSERQYTLEWIGQVVKDLSDLATTSRRAVASIITRPPESIMLATLPRHSTSNIVVIFDSHPRPDLHSSGASFLIFHDLDEAAGYLGRLWPDVESAALEGLDSWQVSLLRSVSVVSFCADGMGDVDMGLWDNDSRMEIVKREYQVLELQTRLDELMRERDRDKELARREISRIRAEKERALEEERRKHEAVLQLKEEVHERAILSLQCRHEMQINDLIKEFTDNFKGVKARAKKAVQLEREEQEVGDYELAKRLQDETDREEATRRERFFECPVCMDMCPEDVVFLVDGCEHKFCRDCASQFVKQDLMNRAYPCICPVCRIAPNSADVDEGSSSSSTSKRVYGEVAHHAVLSVLDEKDRSAWLELERDHAIMSGARGNVYLRCRRCTRPIEVGTSDEVKALKAVTCPYCAEKWCQRCDVDGGHEDSTCEQYQKWKKDNAEGDQRIDGLTLKKGWIKCPGVNCGIHIEKTSGCNHMTCIMCNTHSCYLCGAFFVQSRKTDVIQKAVAKHYSSGTCKNRMLD